MGHSFFATAPRGALEPLGVELRAMGARAVRAARGGVAFTGDLSIGYRACLWSRIASRVLMRVTRFRASDASELYEGTRGVAWREHLGPDDTLAVDFSSVEAPHWHHHFAAQRVKDAIVDQFREAIGRRPNVQRQRPSVRINVHVDRAQATIALDLAGESLHRRGYRGPSTAAPLKENLAAAVLQLAGWPTLAATGAPLLDPLCGSGTLAIEGAWMAGDVAPGLGRSYFGFLGWRGHEPESWEALLAEARERRRVGLAVLPPIFASDRDAAALDAARASLVAAGLLDHVRLQRRSLDQLDPPGSGPGLLVANPPYGERIGRADVVSELYAGLGSLLATQFRHWCAAVLVPESRPSSLAGRDPTRCHPLRNGAIACRLLVFDPRAKRPMRPERMPQGVGPRRTREPRTTSFESASPAVSAPVSPELIDRQCGMFADRLRKNLRRLRRWARREGVDCYRLYDADMPEFALAVDLYRGERLWVHVQEYEAPATVDTTRARARLEGALAVIRDVLGVAREDVFLKHRRRRGVREQYEKLGSGTRMREVREAGCRLLVNLEDYVDTGLFLDQRSTRALLRSTAAIAGGGRFLNLFAYTGAASVQAAAGHARSTLSIDLSATYTDWARRNLTLNGFHEPGHEVVRADCMGWLGRNAAPGRIEPFDLVYVAPPTFSNSKRLASDFDVARDHVDLILGLENLLAPRGMIIFSSHRRGFRLDEQALGALNARDITGLTTAPDFARARRAHRCWRIQRTERP